MIPSASSGRAALDRVHGCVQHQRDPGEVLDGAVVEEEREPPPLVLLRGDDPVGEALPLVLPDRDVREEAGVLDLHELMPPPLAHDQIERGAPGHDDDGDREPDRQGHRRRRLNR